jgi:hypothetical protein
VSKEDLAVVRNGPLVSKEDLHVLRNEGLLLYEKAPSLDTEVLLVDKTVHPVTTRPFPSTRRTGRW